MTGKFDGLMELKGTGNKELAGNQEGETLTPAPPAFVETQVKTKPLSAQIPVDLKLRFDGYMIQARSSGPGMSSAEHRQGVAAMIRLLDDPVIREKWINLIREMPAR